MSRIASVPASVALLVTLAALGSHASWLMLDRVPMANDAAYLYLGRTLDLVHRLPSVGSASELADAIERSSIHGRPPLYQLMAVPFVVLGRGTEDAARGLNLLFLMLGALAVYRWTAGLGTARSGALAVVLFLAYPPIVGLVHDFHPHAIIPSLTAMTLWALTALMRQPSRGRAWSLGVALGIGALVHPSYLALVFVPVVVGLSVLLLSRARRGTDGAAGRHRPSLRALASDRWMWTALLPALAVAVLTVGLWYFLGPGRELLQAYASWKSDAVETFRGRRFVVDGFPELRGRLWYLLSAPAALSVPLVLAGTLGVARSIIRPAGLRWLPVLALINVVAVTYLGETAFAWWKMASALPILAVVTAVATDDLPRLRARRCAVAALGTVAAFNHGYVLFGGSWGDPVAGLMGGRPDSLTCRRAPRHACVLCPQPPRRRHVPEREVVSAIRSRAEGRPPLQRTLLVVDGPLLRPSQVAYWLAREWPGSGFRVRGVGAKTWGLPYNLRYVLRSHFILYVEDPVRADRSSYRQASLRLLGDPPEAFLAAHREIATFGVGTRHRARRQRKTAKLVQRIKPVSVEEAQQVIAALGLSAAEARQAPRLLASILEQERRRAVGAR